MNLKFVLEQVSQLLFVPVLLMLVVLTAWALVALIAMHVGAALKHQFIDRDGLISRMLPGRA